MGMTSSKDSLIGLVTGGKTVVLQYCEQRTDTSRWLPWKAPCPLGMLLIQPSPCTYNFSGIKREMGQLRALTSEGFGLPATLM